MFKTEDLIRKETNRLNNLGVDFKFYHVYEQENVIGIVVDAKDQSPKNIGLIRKAGYDSGREYKSNGQKKIYRIQVEKLEKILKAEGFLD